MKANMKTILYLSLAALLALSGCKKEPSLSELVLGEWRGTGLSADAGVYLYFAPDGTFELYQKLDGETFELRRGTWSVEGNMISGIYNDRQPWATTYKVSVEGKELTLAAQNEGGETNIYYKTEIPGYIKESATVVVKSAY